MFTFYCQHNAIIFVMRRRSEGLKVHKGATAISVKIVKRVSPEPSKQVFFFSNKRGIKLLR